jgi:hypothetical protein
MDGFQRTGRQRMTDSTAAIDTDLRSDAGGDQSERRGWYLYGISRANELQGDDLRCEQAAGDVPPLELVVAGRVAAIVRKVDLDDFDVERFPGPEEAERWLQSLATAHNSVIAGIHQSRPILPARLASLYASGAELREALAASQDTLLAQLDLVDGCDEWAVHVHANTERLDELAAADAGIRGLQTELAGATPGRAYFLQKKLDEAHRVALRAAAALLTHVVELRLGRFARAIHLDRTGQTPPNTAEESEIARLTCLVSRDQRASFHADAQALQRDERLRLELTGPWPPYSFVTLQEETR